MVARWVWPVASSRNARRSAPEPPDAVADGLTLDRRGRSWLPVAAEDALFTGGRLDSLNILHLIGAVEEITGAPVPDHMVVMKHFQTVAAITNTFCLHEA